MPVILVEVPLRVPKESKELIDALFDILEDALAGKKVEAVTENLGGLIKAAQGIDQVPAEVKSKNRDDLAAYAVKKIEAIFDKGARGDEIDSKDL